MINLKAVHNFDQQALYSFESDLRKHVLGFNWSERHESHALFVCNLVVMAMQLAYYYGNDPIESVKEGVDQFLKEELGEDSLACNILFEEAA